MGIIKSAVLFYNDGQVKFTMQPIKDTQHYFREEFMEGDSIQVGDEVPVRMRVYFKEFARRADIFGYAIFEEIR